MLADKSGESLTHPSRATSLHPRHPAITAGVALLSGLAMVAAFGTAPDTDTQSVPTTAVVERLGVIETALPAEGPIPYVREERIRQGDTVATVLNRLGAIDNTLVAFLREDKACQIIFRQISPGKTILLWADEQGNTSRLVFPLNGSGDRALIVSRQGDEQFSAVEEKLPLETRIIMRSAEIHQSLLGAADDAGIPDAIATQLAEVFASEVDFYRDLRKGDRFAVLYESIIYLGKEIRSGKLLAADLANGKRSLNAVWYSSSRGGGGYYTTEGKSLRKAFLRSPLEFSRVTSGFAAARFHPILQAWRAHRGIDYGAPVGTPVRATGGGTVEFAGTQGGYGKVVVIRHAGQVSTLYAHLSGFGSGIRAGAQVRQGSVIGFVGATGLVSGPHLHYEFRRNGLHQNPQTIALPEGPELNQDELLAFRTASAESQAFLQKVRDGRGSMVLIN